MNETIGALLLFFLCLGFFHFGKWIGRDEGYDRCWNEHHGIPND